MAVVIENAANVTGTISGAGSLDWSATFTATAGRLLVVGLGAAPGSTVFSNEDAGWVRIHDGGATRTFSPVWYYKIAAGGETSFGFTTNASSVCYARVIEISGLASSAVLDVKAEDESNLNTAVTSQASGTATGLSVSNGWALAFFANDLANDFDTGRSYDNSFTEEGYYDSATGTGIGFAYKQLSASSDISCTLTTTDAGDEAYGSIAVFKQPAAGGATVSPGVGALTIAGLAPTVNLTHSASPAAGALTLTGHAPVANLTHSANPGVGELTLTGLAPDVSVTSGQTIATNVGALTITGLAPVANLTHSASPDVGVLTITGHAPDVTTTATGSISTGRGELALTGLAPVINLSDFKTIAVGVGELQITGHAPSLEFSGPITVAPEVGILTLVGLAPSVTNSGDVQEQRPAGGGGIGHGGFARKAKRLVRIEEAESPEEVIAEIERQFAETPRKVGRKPKTVTTAQKPLETPEVAPNQWLDYYQSQARALREQEAMNDLLAQAKLRLQALQEQETLKRLEEYQAMLQVQEEELLLLLMAA